MQKLNVRNLDMIHAKVKTEEDFVNKDVAEAKANAWLERFKKVAKEKNLDMNKDFRKIERILDREDRNNVGN
jgi:hypothetical protein